MSEHTGVPLAIPVTSSTEAAEPPNSGRFAPTGATTPSSNRLRSSSPRAGRRDLAAVQASLSARDHQVIAVIGAHRYLTTRQIEGFCFHDHASPLSGARVCRRVLRRLHRLRLLTHLQRRVGGVRAGSASYVWQLGPLGDRLLRASSPGSARVRRYEPSQLFLEHTLAIADVRLRLTSAERSGALELIEVQTEPDCWRPFVGLGGARLTLQPDLFVVTNDPSDPAYVVRWFIEVDRGTENPKRLLSKCARYETYRHSGSDPAGCPLVLWVMSDQAHAERLDRAIEDDLALDAGLFRITTTDELLDVVSRGTA